MYKKVDRIPDFPSMESRLLKFWDEVKAFDLLREKNKGKKRWSFLDGPITANNPMGVHHAWGRSLKDMFQRYHAMCGYDMRYQNGFDCQGLWVEVEVEKELGFGTKDDILEYGVDKFVQKCKDRVKKYSAIQTEQSIRLGYWMDWSNSYYTMSEENNYTIWSFLKKCNDRGFVYKGSDVMPWCPRCGVGLSQMEMHEGYLEVRDPSVVVRFVLKEKDKHALLVWTTTPWTLTSNVAAAVNPDMTYLKIKAGEWTYYAGEENWKGDRTRDSEGKRTGLRNLPDLVGGELEVVGTLPGKQLLGLEYHGPFDDLPAQNAKGGHPFTDESLSDRCAVDCHKVIAWDSVTGSEGTGIVHIAPGCGKEDYELGALNGLVCVAPLDERGRYIEGFDWLETKAASEVAKEIISDLKQRGILVAREDYPHSYPHCWRCKTPVLFRLVDEWFIKMDWRDEIIKTIPDIRWIPEFGQDRELDWLRNMRDWMISKKRYWGLALPIWVCDECGNFEVMGSRKELKERAVEGWDEFDGHTPHKPWIDKVVISCSKCGAKAHRIPDVGNPWLDAGIVPYSTMGYNTDREYWKEWFPADLVLECFPGQFRNWFYALLAMSAMMEGRAPFRTLLGHALVRDEYGKEMHKSLGNGIEFNEAAQTIGAEIMRYLFAAQNPVHNLNFPDIHHSKKQKGKRHLDDEIRRKILTFWNCYSFYIQYAQVDQVKPGQFEVPVSKRTRLDKWILSRLQHLVQHAHECFENYQVHLLMNHWEQFVEEDLSNWYLRRSRRRFWKSESDLEKQSAYVTLYEVLHTCARLMAPVLPFLMEEVYQNMVRQVEPKAPVSIHLLDYPRFDESLVDEDLEAAFGTVIKYKNLGLSLRNKANIKVRQPLGRLIVRPASEAQQDVLRRKQMQAVLLEELNVKALEFIEDESSMVTITAKANFKALGPKLGAEVKTAASKIAELDPLKLKSAFDSDGKYSIEVAGESFDLEPGDVSFFYQGPEGMEVLVEDNIFVGLDTTIDHDLELEGLARDFVRHVQNLRKDRQLNIEDRISLRYSAGEKIFEAITTWQDYIRGEVLAIQMQAVENLDQGKEIKVAGQKAIIDLAKAEV